MKKQLKFLISVILVILTLAGVFALPAASYENDIETSSECMMLLNLDTNTPCYYVKPNRKWYASYLSEILTFIVASQKVDEPEKIDVQITQDIIDELPYSDGCLTQYIDKKLTLKDLMAIMMFTSGSDAAYLIAGVVADGDIDRFVEMMNSKAADLNCRSSLFVSPGYSDSIDQHTTCNDVVRMYKVLMNNALYQEIMESAPVYTPEGMKGKKASVTTENSMLNDSSPYYFRYCTGGKYTYDDVGKSNLVITTRYRNKNYLFVALHGKNTSEKNTFSDARHLTSWGYLYLSDRKVIDSDDVVTTYLATASWDSYEVPLYAGNSAYKTLPMSYEEELFSNKLDVPEKVKMPIFKGQVIGKAKVYYDGHEIDDINLISNTSEGVSLMKDLPQFGRSVMDEIFTVEPPTEAPTEAPTKAPTAAPTETADKAQE